MDIEFSSLSELYHRLEPALAVKEAEFKRCDYDVTKQNIWQFLAQSKWSVSNNLLLHQMVSDILNLKHNEILEFLNK